MIITYQQANILLKSIAIAVPDQLTCDGCQELIAEFAEVELKGEKLSEAMRAVRSHLSQCVCCAYEYEAMLEALQAANDPDN